MISKITIFMILVLGLLLVACSSETESTVNIEVSQESNVEAATPQIKTVTIQDLKFNPVDVEISAGDTIEWVNLDDVAHTVTLENGDFDREIGIGATITYTFSEADVYRYFCRYHPGMQGSVIVN